jgi:hypothetical protein
MGSPKTVRQGLIWGRMESIGQAVLAFYPGAVEAPVARFGVNAQANTRAQWNECRSRSTQNAKNAQRRSLDGLYRLLGRQTTEMLAPSIDLLRQKNG